MEVLRVSNSPCRPRSARYAEKGYPNYAEDPDLCGPATTCRQRSARHAEKGCRDNAEPDVRAAAPCSPRSAPCAEKGYSIYAEPPDVCAPSAPCRPRSAGDAVKGYPDYAEPAVRAISAAPRSPRSAPCTEKGQPDRRRGHEWDEGGIPLKKPVLYYERRRRRTAAKATGMAVALVSPFLQGVEAVTQDGRRWRTMVGAPMATGNKEVVPMDGVADEHGGGEGGGKSARLRVKETLRVFNSYYLHFVQEEQQRVQAVRQELKASRALKRKAGDQGLTFPLATSIVMSGVYEDDFDKADEIIYTGEGGNNFLGNSHQKTNQTLLRGNLALKNSKDNGNPIRVIRGHKDKDSYTGKVYTYDGLYKKKQDTRNSPKMGFELRWAGCTTAVLVLQISV